MDSPSSKNEPGRRLALALWVGAGLLGIVVGGIAGLGVAALAFAPLGALVGEAARRMWRPMFVEPLRMAEEESSAWRAQQSDPGKVHGKAIGVFVTSALCLTLLEYVGMSNRYVVVVDILRSLHLDGAAAWLEVAMREQINRLTWWALWCVVSYLVIPAFVVVAIFRENLRDYGFRVKGAFDDAWMYGVFLMVMIPTAIVVSADPHFQSTYPFYDMAPGESVWPNLVRWELLYFLQFLSLEFFFRGFMVHGTRERLGALSVFAMMVPYCMIHFGKPMPETVGAVIAGAVLGSLSLRTRSIWLGVCIHTTIALGMDVASLLRQGLLGGG